MACGPTFDIFFVVVAANVDSGRRCPHYSYAPGGRGHQTTKNAKKQTQRRQRRPLLCVDESAFDAAFSPLIFFTLSWKFGKTQPRQSKLDVV